MSKRLRLLQIPALIISVLLLTSFLKDRTFDPHEAAVIFVALALLALVGVGVGVWSARRQEKRHKAREDIWLKH